MILGLDSSEPGKSLEMYERFFSSLATHAKALPRLHKAILASNPRRERGVVYFAMIGREENAAKLSKVRIQNPRQREMSGRTFQEDEDLDINERDNSSFDW